MFKRIIRRLVTELYVRLPIKQSKTQNKEVIIALTSYPARLQKLNIVIRSLLKQSITPDKIILYLGKDTKTEDIPAKLSVLQKYNFEIRTDYEDIKPHKKYFYVMQEHPDKTIITVDDDLIYDKHLVRDLTNTARNNPRCVCARRVNLITWENNQINKYNDWKWEYRGLTVPSHQLLATGCGGILYPPHLLPVETFNLEAIKAHCLNTDDIWLKFMELKADVKVVWTNSKIVHPLSLRGSQESALMHTNTASENRNDININNMISYTGINPVDYFEKQ